MHALSRVLLVLAASTVSAAFDARQVPEQLHLAFAGADAGSGMTVSWATAAATPDAAVWLGTVADALAVADARVQSASYFSEGDYTLVQHHATLRGLSPSTKYFYKVGSPGDDALQSNVSSFTTARAATDTTTFEVAVYGDAGDGANSASTIKLVNALAGQVDFIYHIGDISYADDDFLAPGALLKFGFEQVWNNWTNSLAPAMRTTPYMVVVGNHEAECHSPACAEKATRLRALGNYTAYNARFRMPANESGGALNMWHSFDHGPLHVTSISTESDFANAPTNQYTAVAKNGNFGDQLAWLEADLKKADANRARVPWVLVGMHRPMYHVGYVGADGNPTAGTTPQFVQQAFEELFLKYKVDVVLAGHEHSYERHLPIARGAAVADGVSADRKTYASPKAPVHIITGAAGNAEGHTARPSNTAVWAVASDYEHFGISKLKASRAALEWTFVAAASGEVLDQFVITKGGSAADSNAPAPAGSAASTPTAVSALLVLACVAVATLL
ncbi:hypothetical protein PybrP1_012587 [[Pythium] brassicae (nom. inval.)]|nr:hypothetical protein PybrP1_012587 [[Pythium] brassicae (nom. inval.)]